MDAILEVTLHILLEMILENNALIEWQHNGKKFLIKLKFANKTVIIDLKKILYTKNILYFAPKQQSLNTCKNIKIQNTNKFTTVNCLACKQ